MSDSAAVVRRFFGLLQDGRAAEAVELLADDIEWRNSYLPTVHGPRSRRILVWLERRGIHFRADFNQVATEGESVLTDRTDYVRFKRWEGSFRIFGTFVVRDGKIVYWYDHYSMGNVLRGSLKGLLQLARSR